jgi:Family of unknown function (DUF6209)
MIGPTEMKTTIANRAKKPAPAPTDLARPQIPNARLRFLPEWRQVQECAIRAGGKLVIEFDPARLPTCRQNWRGAEVWDIQVFVCFHPGNQRVEASTLQDVRQSGMVVRLDPKPVEVLIPPDAQQVEMWFLNTSGVSSRCEAWDSRYGQNYWFDVVAAEPP